MSITLPAYAKINWALNITGLRADGYHLLDMVMQRIELHDDLTLTPSDDLRLTVNGSLSRRIRTTWCSRRPGR